MWRRRFPRPILPFLRRPYPIEPIDPALIEANRLFETGNYLSSAELFESLANRRLHRRGTRAPRLIIEAGLARILGNEVAAGIALVYQGLGFLGQQQRWREFQRIGNRLVETLKEKGMEKQSAEIARFLATGSVVEPSPAEGLNSAAPKSSKPSLPTHCPSCGAPVYPQELEWADENTAACEFCGNLMRGGNT